MAELFPRRARDLVVEALGDTRAVFLLGARQVGKSTLARQIATERGFAETANFDERGPREAALQDPAGFVAELAKPVLIDEVQRGGPELLLAIKSAVDEDLSPGQFLLTGSANLFRSRKVLDALTGRIEIVTLWPLAQAEIEKGSANFVDALFRGDPPRVAGAPRGRDALRDRIAAGGYPEARLRVGRRRSRWFESYLRTTLERDLESIADAYKLQEMPRLLRLLSTQAANLFVPAGLRRKLDLDHRTVDRYAALLEATFLLRRIPAWRPGLGQREVLHPKLHMVDSGLLLHLLGANNERLLADDRVTGKALENFVAMEVVKHADWAVDEARVHHYRRGSGEVDLVLEDRAGRICAIEVKAGVSISASDWRTMAKVRDARGEDFRCGVLLYTGADTVPLGDRLFALPLSALWV